MKKLLSLLASVILIFSCQPSETDVDNQLNYGSVEQIITQLPERVKNTVESDGHPIAVWEKSLESAEEAVLLVHGRTWSAVPDFDLQAEGEKLSLMDALVEEGYAVYAIDLRGYGATP
ncbi:MAG: alpha/beta hydrolase, partial [Bacteroidota bacterium]